MNRSLYIYHMYNNRIEQLKYYDMYAIVLEIVFADSLSMGAQWRNNTNFVYAAST